MSKIDKKIAMEIKGLTQKQNEIFTFLYERKVKSKNYRTAHALLVQAFLNASEENVVPLLDEWTDFNAISADRVQRVCKTVQVSGFQLWVGHLGAARISITGTQYALDIPGSDSRNFCGEAIGEPTIFPIIEQQEKETVA